MPRYTLRRLIVCTICLGAEIALFVALVDSRRPHAISTGYVSLLWLLYGGLMGAIVMTSNRGLTLGAVVGGISIGMALQCVILLISLSP